MPRSELGSSYFLGSKGEVLGGGLVRCTTRVAKGGGLGVGNKGSQGEGGT